MAKKSFLAIKNDWKKLDTGGKILFGWGGIGLVLGTWNVIFNKSNGNNVATKV